MKYMKKMNFHFISSLECPFGPRQREHVFISFQSFHIVFILLLCRRFASIENDVIEFSNLSSLDTVFKSYRFQLKRLGAPNELFCSGYFAGKIDPILCVAGKMKCICWETFQKTFY